MKNSTESSEPPAVQVHRGDGQTDDRPKPKPKSKRSAKERIKDLLGNDGSDGFQSGGSTGIQDSIRDVRKQIHDLDAKTAGNIADVERRSSGHINAVHERLSKTEGYTHTRIDQIEKDVVDLRDQILGLKIKLAVSVAFVSLLLLVIVMLAANQTS